MSLSETDSKLITVGDLRKRVIDAKGAAQGSGIPIALPRWQRSLVWSDESRRELIESVRSGFPIGSLLVHQDSSGDDGTVLLLVDGLQRTEALIAHSDNPLEHLQASDFDEVKIRDILRGLGNSHSSEDVDRAQSQLAEWGRSLRGQDETETFDTAELLEKLRGDANSVFPDTVRHLAREVIREVKEANDIDQVKIPLLVYTGNAGNLPAIFERLNRQGTKLSDYEVYAASWSDVGTFIIGNDQIRQKIVERYSEAEEKGFEVREMPSASRDEQFHLFEYLFGLDHLLADSARSLFAVPKSVTEVKGYAFNLVSLSLGVRIPEMKTGLPKAFPRKGKGKGALVIDPSDLEANLVESAEFVADSLDPILRLKLNQKNKEVKASMPEYLAYSLVGRAFAGKWRAVKRDDGSVKNFELRGEHEADRARLKTGIRRRYLQDLVNKEWRGQLQGLAWRRIWGETTGTRAELSPDARMAEELSWEDLERDLDSWFEDQLERTQVERPNVSVEEKTFLRFVYANLITHAQDRSETYEIEHLFPVKRLADSIKHQDDRGWPISCIANLAVLPKEVNRKRLDKTFPEYLATLDEDKEREVRAKIEPLLLCSVDDLAIPESGHVTKDDYLSFLRTRWIQVKETTRATLEQLDRA